MNKAETKISIKIKSLKFLPIIVIIAVIISSCNGGSSGISSIASISFESELFCGSIGLKNYVYDQNQSNEFSYEEINYNSSNSPRDPLANYQWHLDFRGQDMVYGLSKSDLERFGIEVGNGIDINVKSVHNDYLIRGEGVNVVVHDSGLEVYHEDLRVEVENSYSFVNSSNDTTPSIINAKGAPICDDHGTAVAGLIAAKSGNNVGGVGVAPNATLLGTDITSINYIAEEEQNINSSYASKLSSSFGVPPEGEFEGLTNGDIFNFSWGGVLFEPSNNNVNDSVKSMLSEGVNKGRDDKGYIYIQSSGNYYMEGSEYLESEEESPYPGLCAVANKLGVGCHITDFESVLNNPYIIKVGGLFINGKATNYSSSGSNMFISAPSGGVSFQYKNLLPTTGEDLCAGKQFYCNPAVITTDLMGCQRGYSYEPVGMDELHYFNIFNFNEFEYTIATKRGKYEVEEGVIEDLYKVTKSEPHRLNQECNYTSTFSGTSSAAPIASGVVALILEKNPDLTWREVKYILAKTAKKVDQNLSEIYFRIGNDENEDNTQVSYSKDFTKDVDRYLLKKDDTYTNQNENNYFLIRDNWIVNDAGFNFSNRYGFGAIDAKAAIDFETKIPNHLKETSLKEHEFNVLKGELPPGYELGQEKFYNIHYILKREERLVDKDVFYIESISNMLNESDVKNQPDSQRYAINVDVNLDENNNNPIEKVGINLSGFTKNAGEIYIGLTSPNGSKSILLHPFTEWNRWNLITDFTIYSNAFYQEEANGEWLVDIYSVENSINDTNNNDALIDTNDIEASFTMENPAIYLTLEDGEDYGKINDFVYDVNLIIYN